MTLKTVMWKVLLLAVITFYTALGAQDYINEKDIDTSDPETQRIIKESLLQTMGLSKKPRVKKDKVHIPPYMLHLFHMQDRENTREELEKAPDNELELQKAGIDPDILANTVRSYTHQESDGDLKAQDSMVLKFNITGLPQNEIVRAVQLRISNDGRFLDIVKDSNVTDIYDKNRKWTKEDVPFLHRVRVYDIIKPSIGEREQVHRLLDTSVVDSRKSGTVQFDVISAALRWRKSPQANYGLFVEVTPFKTVSYSQNPKHSVRFQREPGQREAEWAEEQPLLVIITDDGTAKPRTKRSSNGYSYKPRKYCDKYKLTIDFKQVEWTDWIVAPAGYDAYFCYGSCSFPLSERMNATNHAVVQTLLNSRYPSRVPAACCVPTVHRAISMLYVDEDERVVLKNYQDMIVESCGCR